VTNHPTQLGRRQLPRLLAGLSYQHRADLAEHERCYGPLPAATPR
jgi:hypothetical protein